MITTFFCRDGEFSILGFREHIFTNSQSCIGRYMAIAEFSFVTLIQRFLAKLHNVRSPTCYRGTPPSCSAGCGTELDPPPPRRPRVLLHNSASPAG